MGEAVRAQELDDFEVGVRVLRPADEADSHGHGENDAPAKSSAAANAVRWFTLIISAATFGISLLLLTRYNQGTAGFQMVVWKVGQPISVRHCELSVVSRGPTW